MTGSASGRCRYDPWDPAFLEDPYPVLDELRARDPLHVTPEGIQVVTRYDHVRSLLRDARCSSESPSRRAAISGRRGAAAESFARALVSRDPPDHTALRRLLAAPYARREVAGLRQFVRERVDDLLDRAERAGQPGLIDVITAVAEPLPYLVNHAVLGLPREDFPILRSDAIAIEKGARPSADRDARTVSDSAVMRLKGYFFDFFHHRRDDARPGGLLSTLTGAEPGGSLDLVDLVDNAKALFLAGAEETAGLIGNLLSALLDAPDQLAAVRADRTLIPAAVEEVLRFDSPIKVAFRWAAEPVEVGGCPVRAGRFLALSLSGANRDPARFPEPGIFDIHRSGMSHIAFGSGRHVCLGAHLARLQAEVVLDRMLARYPVIERAGLGRRRRVPELRTFDHLPVAVGETGMTMIGERQ